MKPSYVLYVLGLIGVLLFTANCDCDDDVDPQHYWVVCEKQSDGSNIPVLTNGSSYHYNGQNFNPNQYRCPNTGNSPIWKSSTATYNTAPSSTQHSNISGFKPKALGPGQGAYLPAPILSLPFSAQRSGSESTTLNCDPSQPDIFQVNHDNASVNRIGTCPFQFKATIPVATRPLQIAITPDGSTMLVTSFDNAVNFINPATNQVTFTLNTGTINPNGLAITPDGAFAYITNFVTGAEGASISKIDLSSQTIVQTIPAFGSYPQNLILSPDGAQLYVTYPYENVVQILDTLTNLPVAAISVPAPRDIAFNSKGTKAYIAEAGNPDSATMGVVQLFDTNTFQLGTTYQVGLGPNDIAVLYGDRYVVTSNYEGQSTSMIDTITGAVQTTAATGPISGLAIVY
jgi:DNA-binding beta-propeller fold protein YncE